MNNKDNHVLYNKDIALTGNDFYNQQYNNQLIQILTTATAFVVGTIMFELIISLIKKNVDYNSYWYDIILITLVLILIPLATNLFTYQQIISKKNILIN
jgi:hypothetical protein